MGFVTLGKRRWSVTMWHVVVFFFFFLTHSSYYKKKSIGWLLWNSCCTINRQYFLYTHARYKVCDTQMTVKIYGPCFRLIPILEFVLVGLMYSCMIYSNTREQIVRSLGEVPAAEVNRTSLHRNYSRNIVDILISQWVSRCTFIHITSKNCHRWRYFTSNIVDSSFNAFM